MRTRPFLSYKRQDAAAVAALKRELCLAGAGGWRDLDDLVPGEDTESGVERAIDQSTGGFIWYATRRAAASSFINEVELPRAIARKRRNPRYPLVPLFLAPIGELLGIAGAALSEDDIALLRQCNGEVRRGQPTVEFHRRVAERYMRAAVHSLEGDRFTLLATSMATPAGGYDLTFDWREAVPEGTRVIADRMQERLCSALSNLREALQTKARAPEVVVDLGIPLPLGMLLGYEWRTETRIKFVAQQWTESALVDIPATGPEGTGWPDWVERRLDGSGPTVIAVAATADPLDRVLEDYARQQGASRTFSLHVPGRLNARGMRGLARHIALKGRETSSEQPLRHLLIAGPVSLAALVGTKWNANGPIRVPLWNGRAYGSEVTVGST
jgi:hypothetical protein